MTEVQFKDVNFSYGEGTFCLDNINLSVEEGEFIAVLGHNGSGKSTLARLCNGLLTPTSGDVLIEGMNVRGNEQECRKKVGVVFQNPDNQMVASIVEDDVAFGPENIAMPREEIGKSIEFSLSAVGMQEYRHATPTHLSGGQKQRIAVAGVLAISPKVLILDESTAMLDPRGRKEILDVVTKLNREHKMTVIMITHFMDEAMMADRAIVMHQGKIVLEGTPREVFSHDEEIEKYSLTLPTVGYICKQLQKRGLPFGDCYCEEEFAKEVEKCVSSSND